MLLIVALAILVGAAVGGIVGDASGRSIGLIADELSDFDEKARPSHADAS